ncbi:unnamed protein product [Strongylus vulgaris]|uniref:Uncharacterized protein n=1 Tax=Strongylus vulgaris TaxID=40348 RepID=A0A3P7KSP6_STRVU|nr:unnamed protein product [Strongylus vulgaris]
MDLDPYFVMFSSIPLVIQLKVNLTLTIAIAIERNLALFSPFLYRKLPPIYFATFSLFLGFLFAAWDLMLEFVSSPIVRVPNCPALGCFLQDDFRFYWGTSSMVNELCVIILTTTILVKLRRVEKRLRVAKIFLGKESSGFKQGNRISLGILIISLLFVTLPSVAAGFFRIAGFSFFKTVGLFYIVGLLCAGEMVKSICFM